MMRVPLTELIGGYQGQLGGLYSSGNAVPAAHLARMPQVDIGASFAFVSIGFSNVKMAFCDPAATRDRTVGGAVGQQKCATWSFVGQAQAVARNPRMVIVNGAQSSQVASAWDDVSDPMWTMLDGELAKCGRAPAQVRVAWMLHANRLIGLKPPTLPTPGCDADNLASSIGRSLRAAKRRYPNLQVVYLSSLHGIAAGSVAPAGGPCDEPYAYEAGFAVRRVVAAQIEQLAGLSPDPLVGDLSLAVAPWICWGPYLWSTPNTKRADGFTLSWPQDFKADNSHPTPSGRKKLAAEVLKFFQREAWF
jgi:hypothetical protein